MSTYEAPQVLMDLLTLPTAPLNEGFVVDYVRRWAAERPTIAFRQDAFGNVLLEVGAEERGSKLPPSLKTVNGGGKAPPSSKLAKRQAAGSVLAASACGGGASDRPLVLAGHMDHPGFEAVRTIGRAKLAVEWRGWVRPEYFPGTKVRFFSEGRWVRGTVGKTKLGMVRGLLRVTTAEVKVESPVQPGSPGMWDLPDPVVKGDRLYARGCDDVAGVAGILFALDQLAQSRKRPAGRVVGLLTRAEEVGFGGAIAACRGGSIPKNARIVAVETSSEIPGVRMGDGPILRVGDASAIFSPRLTGYCRLVAKDLAKKHSAFKYQRKLMDGGTCESTVYCEEGYEATGLCVALGNYHNMDTRRQKIASEYIHLGDFDGLVKWFVAMATTRRSGDTHHREIAAMIGKRERELLPALKRTVARVRGARG